jgi:hypothetical protein
MVSEICSVGPALMRRKRRAEGAASSPRRPPLEVRWSSVQSPMSDSLQSLWPFSASQTRVEMHRNIIEEIEYEDVAVRLVRSEGMTFAPTYPSYLEGLSVTKFEFRNSVTVPAAAPAVQPVSSHGRCGYSRMFFLSAVQIVS